MAAASHGHASQGAGAVDSSPAGRSMLLVGDGSGATRLIGRPLIGAFVGGELPAGLDGRVLASGGTAGVSDGWLPSEAEAVCQRRRTGWPEAAASASGDPRLSVLRAWDCAERLEADAARFARIYRPVSILPPDQYLALVIQATEGCSYNRCTFCDFYRDRPFRIKSAVELRHTLREVVDFFGEAMGLRGRCFSPTPMRSSRRSPGAWVAG
jgi:hypothetical protein